MRRRIAYGLFVTLGSAAFGQALVSASSSLNSSGQAVYDATFSFSQEPFTDPVVPGSPYSADEVLETIRIQGDGRRVEQSALIRRLNRDSQGRIRIERRLQMGPVVPNGPAMVEIIDPTTSNRYVIDPEKKIAHRWSLLLPGERRVVSAVRTEEPTAVTLFAGAASAPPAAQAVQNQNVDRLLEPAVAMASTVPPTGPPGESLGNRMIQGVQAQGTRYTYRSAAGVYANSRASTTELWIAWNLQLTLISKLNAMDGSETTTSLKNLKVAEPATSLFQVPPDYTLIDESGTFKIQFMVTPPTAN